MDLNKDHLLTLLLRRGHLYKLYPNGNRLMLEKKLFDQSYDHMPVMGYTLKHERIGITKHGVLYNVSESVEYFKIENIEKAVDAYISRATNKDPSVITFLGCEQEELFSYDCV